MFEKVENILKELLLEDLLIPFVKDDFLDDNEILKSCEIFSYLHNLDFLVSNNGNIYEYLIFDTEKLTGKENFIKINFTYRSGILIDVKYIVYNKYLFKNLITYTSNIVKENIIKNII